MEPCFQICLGLEHKNYLQAKADSQCSIGYKASVYEAAWINTLPC